MSTLPLPQYDVSVILVNYNTAHLLERCLGDLRRASGGLKVQTEHAWFAARPSGTEDVYKIYAESLRDEAHLARLLDEARALVAEAFNAA